MADFATLAQVKAWMTITVSTDDTLLNDLIAQTTAAMQNYMTRQIFTATVTETYNGTGTPRLSLRQKPVTAVASLVVNGQAIAAATSPIGSGFLFDDLGISLTPGTIVGGGPWGGGLTVFPRNPLNTVVTYTGGFTTAPADLTDAEVRQVALEYRGRQREGEASKSLGAGQTVSFMTQAWHPRTLEIMDRYKTNVPV